MGNSCNTTEKNEQLNELEIENEIPKNAQDKIIYYPMESSPIPQIHLKEIKSTKKNQDNSTIIYSDGSKYEGDVSDDLPNGFGEFHHKNGDKYLGKFLKGYANGMGTYTYSNGIIYKGKFLKDMKNGSGEEIYLNGDIFKGSFKKNYKMRGDYVFKDGISYNGIIQNNKRNGLGAMKFPSKETYYGDWLDNCKHGKGKLVYADERVFEGEFRNNMEVLDDQTINNQNI